MSFNPLKRSLRAKVTLGVVLPLVLILGIFSIIQYAHHQQLLLSNLSLLAAHSGQVIEADLRHAMLQSDFGEVQAVLDAISKSGDFRVVYLLDTSGRVIFAPNGEGVGTQLDNHQPDCQPCHRLPVELRPSSVVVTNSQGQRVFRSMQPIENAPECATCHGSEEHLRGLLLTDIATAPLEASLAGDLRENLLWLVGTIVVTVLVVNFVISRFVLRRLEKIATVIVGFSQGKLLPLALENQPDEIGQLAGTFTEMAHQVKARDAENRELSENLRHQNEQRGELLKRLITAQEDERKRVARELHDELGQALSGLAFRAEAMGQLISSSPENALEKLDQIRELTRETTHRMYDLIWDLRPSALDDMGLAVAIRAYAERLLADTGITFTLKTNRLKDRPPPEIETVLYRILQETLNNVVRHAEAKQVHITLHRQDGAYVAEVVDDGRGFDPLAASTDGHSSRGLGLLGMQERAAQCGGQLQIISQPGSGTRIHIQFPLMEVPSE